MTIKKLNLFQGEINRHDASRYNACVGNNGWVGMHSYIDGFQSSTIILLETLLKNTDKQDYDGFFWGLDTAIYPILFSARHFLELYLKQQIYRINILRSESISIKDVLIKTHNIHELWILLIKQVKDSNDKRLFLYLDKIHQFLVAFHKVDPTGETFRYPYGKNNDLHLVSLKVIGLKTFYENFKKFSTVANEFSYLTNYLLQEYRVKTFTRKLSRKDINEIAKSLPMQKKWAYIDFKVIKDKIKNKYQISSNELTEAIDIIKNHREFGYIISKNYNMTISENNLIEFITTRNKYQFLLKLSISDLACIKALNEISIPVMNSQYYSEDLDSLEKIHLKEMTYLNSFTNDCYYLSYNQKRTIKGLEKLGYIGTLEKIKNIFYQQLFDLIKRQIISRKTG